MQAHFQLPDSNLNWRIRKVDDVGYLALKSERSGCSRAEFESEVNVEFAELLLGMAGESVLEKTRYPHLEGGRVWAIDIFHNLNDGLVIAEVQLASPTEELTVPEWSRIEVTNDDRFYSDSLCGYPVCDWPGGLEGVLRELERGASP